MKIALYRILGNDLPPRHKIGQTFDNLKFILEHEPNFPNCKKKWIVNRIVAIKAKQQIINILKKTGQNYIDIPFDLQEYRNCKRQKIINYPEKIADRERRNKIIYVMNNNGARNVALRDGKQKADWILPFDGNSCFTEEGWQKLISRLSVQESTDMCFAVPMYRLTGNNQYFNFNPNNFTENEPQVIFGKTSTVTFNELYYYGYCSKLELLYRLKFNLGNISDDIIVTDPKYKCGYVVRLFSGVILGESYISNRTILREKAIDLILAKLDKYLSTRD